MSTLHAALMTASAVMQASQLFTPVTRWPGSNLQQQSEAPNEFNNKQQSSEKHTVLQAVVQGKLKMPQLCTCLLPASKRLMP
jgi:hypothetical protein